MQSTESLRNERSRKIVLASIAAVMAKALAMLAPLITIGITFNYLGQELYGLWNTVASFFVLFSYADLGLGSGLATKLGRASAQENAAVICKRLISTAYCFLLVVAGVLMVAFSVVYPLVDWAIVMNAESETAVALAGGVVLAIVMPKIVSIPLSLVQRTQIALQDGFNSYVWQCFGSVLSIVSVYAIYGLNLGPLAMIWASSMIGVVVLALNSVFYFGFKKKDLRPSLSSGSRQSLRELVMIGLGFFGLSILTNLGLSLDNYIVATAQNLNEAAAYSVLYKIVQVVAAVCTVISGNLWGANGEALERGDYEWVRKSTRRMSIIFFCMTLSLSFVLLFAANPVATILLGQNLEFDPALIMGLCLMQLTLATISPHFMVLNAAGKVKIQLLIFAIYTPVSVIAKFFFCSLLGVSAIPWTGAFLYLVMIVPWVLLAERRILRHDKGMQHKISGAEK